MDKSIFSAHQKRLIDLLRECRLEAGLRQSDLAQRLQQPQSFVSKYELGERCLDFLEVRQVCIALSIPFSKFVQRYEKIIQEESKIRQISSAKKHA